MKREIIIKNNKMKTKTNGERSVFKSTKTSENRNKTYKETENTQEDQQNRESNSIAIKYTCEVCRKSFINKEKLKIHRQTHTSTPNVRNHYNMRIHNHSQQSGNLKQQNERWKEKAIYLKEHTPHTNTNNNNNSN